MADSAVSPPDQDARPVRVMPWHRRVVQALLYGRDVDRDRKARARLGLAILGFAIIYGIIASKLVIFAIAPDSHAARRGGSGDAVATARPDILDRNGEILATDVKTPSLFGEPRRIIDSPRKQVRLRRACDDQIARDAVFGVAHESHVLFVPLQRLADGAALHGGVAQPVESPRRKYQLA